MDFQTYESSQKLLKQMDSLPVQAEGHIPESVNLRFQPSRDSTLLAALSTNQKIDVFARKVVERPSQIDKPSSPPVKEAWYLVRADQHAGWVLGRFVSLNIPQLLSAYGQGSNVVAWQVLNYVEDGDRQMPQYLVADRMGNPNVDFTHIRVFTWWVKNQRYVTAYVESGLQGYFPIRVMRSGKVPYFRLPVIDKDGNKVQRVYGLFDTITRLLGTVEGWESDAMPAQIPSRRARRYR